jgi:hypothetical protein
VAKRVVSIVICISFFSVFFTACSSFQEEYKPLYQVKPNVEKIEED